MASAISLPHKACFTPPFPFPSPLSPPILHAPRTLSLPGCPPAELGHSEANLDPEGFPGGSADTDSTCNSGDPGSIPGSGSSPGEGNSYPLPIFLPGESHGQRSLAGYSLWGRKESDTTEWLTLSLSGPLKEGPERTLEQHRLTRQFLRNVCPSSEIFACLVPLRYR